MQLTCIRGDSTSWTFQLLEDGLPRDITADFIRFTIKNQYSDLDSLAIIRRSSTTSGVQVVFPQSGDTKGQFIVTLLHADTKLLYTTINASGRAVWDIQFTLASGNVVTPFYGDFVIPLDVTRNSGSIASDV